MSFSTYSQEVDPEYFLCPFFYANYCGYCYRVFTARFALSSFFISSHLEISRHIQAASMEDNNMGEILLQSSIFPFVRKSILTWLDGVLFASLGGMFRAIRIAI